MDKAGRDYIEHPRTVASQFTDDDHIIVALLHDVLEDTFVTEQTIRNLFGNRIGDACKVLTHSAEVSYADYIQQILPNSLARDIKRADLQNNMDLTRLPKVTQQDIDRVEKKYKPALEQIGAV